MTEFIGYAAAVLTTVSFLPQLIKAVRSKDTKSLSAVMLVVLLIGLALWLTYGILVESMPIIGANSVSMVLIGTVLVFKIRYG